MINIPLELRMFVQDCTWEPVTIGHSEAKTFLLEGPQSNHYLKVQAKGSLEGLHAEKERVEWLQGQLRVPKVHYYGEDDGNEYLLMSELKGHNAVHSTQALNLPEMLTSVGEMLKTIHSIPIANCPFHQTLDVKIHEAKKRVDLGLVDEDDFDEERIGRKADELFDELLSKRPSKEHLVFTHGDFCLPNVIVEEGIVSGVIDWGRAGIADNYQDLSLAIRSITSNYGKEFVPFFLKGYGVTELDTDRIYYYQLLDEFF